jgi:nucleoside-diphosphate-sugar epimerase
MSLKETCPVKPTSTYGRHKHMAEELCLHASEMHGLRTIMIRYFSLYGPGLRKQIVWDISRRIYGGETCIELFGDGGETRDFLFIDDAVSLALQAYKHAPEGHSTINGGSGTATTIAELGSAIAAAADAKVTIKFNGQTREGDPRHLLACPLKAQSFGFEIGTDLPDGLIQVARWVRTLPRI